METFVICALIILSYGLLLWEVRAIGRSIVKAVEESIVLQAEDGDEDEVDLAVGESAGVPVIIGLMQKVRAEHPTVRCDICDNKQCIKL